MVSWWAVLAWVRVAGVLDLAEAGIHVEITANARMAGKAVNFIFLPLIPSLKVDR
jgi:hypothetical protein